MQRIRQRMAEGPGATAPRTAVNGATGIYRPEQNTALLNGPLRWRRLPNGQTPGAASAFLARHVPFPLD
eukprot:184416-Lingulodinium_polyedra.AAC.1